MFIMKDRPQIVDSFEEFNGANPFEPIKLCGAIIDPALYDKEKHGILSAVVRYKTPYMLDNGEPYKLSFALGTDMSVNSIFGLPGILEILLEPRLLTNVFLAHNSQAKFAIEYKETTRTDITPNESEIMTMTTEDQFTAETTPRNMPVIPIQHSCLSSFTDSAACIIQSASIIDSSDIQDKE